MRILILGGSGILSTDFTKNCLDGGNEVFIVNRGKRKEFIDNRSFLITADLRNETVNSVREKIQNLRYDVVVDFLSYNAEQIKKTLSIVEGLFTQYVFISSATAYVKNTPDQIIDEKTEIGNRDWDYAYNKSLCEEYLIEQDIYYTIIRPYVTFGKSRIPFPIIPDGYHFSLLKRIIEEKPVVLFEDGLAICTLTNTKDFAEVLYRLLLNEKAYKEAFHITNNIRQTWNEVYLELCKILGKNPNPISVTMAEIQKYMLEFASILKGDKGQNMLFDNAKVLNAIGGYDFKYSPAQGLRESVDFYLSNETMQAIDYKWDGRCDYLIYKKTGVKLNRVNSSNNKNVSNYWYTIMTNTLFRKTYELLKKVRHKLK